MEINESHEVEKKKPQIQMGQIKQTWRMEAVGIEDLMTEYQDEKEVLLRSKQRRYLVIANVEKAFLQVHLKREDEDVT
ncbi:unnamed protein product, partial [Onchocerca ochengi]|uniref:PH domain-containing protein n=1 Tax=Onchocerca ochengi TaxID=42157 RepID=A0A182EEH2_ONCOC